MTGENDMVSTVPNRQSVHSIMYSGSAIMENFTFSIQFQSNTYPMPLALQ